MSRSFSPARLEDMTTDRLQDEEFPDIDSVSLQSQNDGKVIENGNNCEITLSNAAFGEIAAILKEIEGDDIDFAGE